MIIIDCSLFVSVTGAIRIIGLRLLTAAAYVQLRIAQRSVLTVGSSLGGPSWRDIETPVSLSNSRSVRESRPDRSRLARAGMSGYDKEIWIVISQQAIMAVPKQLQNRPTSVYDIVRVCTRNLSPLISSTASHTRHTNL